MVGLLNNTKLTMRLPLLSLLVGIVGFVSARSAEGSKLLVVIDEDADKTRYSQFWTDLQGMNSSIS